MVALEILRAQVASAARRTVSREYGSVQIQLSFAPQPPRRRHDACSIVSATALACNVAQRTQGREKRGYLCAQNLAFFRSKKAAEQKRNRAETRRSSLRAAARRRTARPAALRHRFGTRRLAAGQRVYRRASFPHSVAKADSPCCAVKPHTAGLFVSQISSAAKRGAPRGDDNAGKRAAGRRRTPSPTQRQWQLNVVAAAVLPCGTHNTSEFPLAAHFASQRSNLVSLFQLLEAEA